MFGSLLGLFASLLIFFTGTYIPDVSQSLIFPRGFFLGLFGILLLLSLFPWILTILFSKKEKLSSITEASMCSCFYDRHLVVFSGAIFLFALSGILLCSQILIPIPLAFGVAIFEVGIIMDLLKSSILRVYEKSSPSGIADWLVERCKKAVRKKDEAAVLDSFEQIFSLLVMYTKQGDGSSMRIFSMRVVTLIEELLRSISILPLFRLSKEDTLLDRYSVAEALTAKRLSLIMKEAEKEENLTALEQSMRLYGKLFMAFHTYHESLGYLLFITLSQSLLTIKKPGDTEKDAEFMMICSELVKSLIDTSNERKISEKNAIIRILKILDAYGKECFRKDRSMSPAFLMQPFAEIGELLGSDRYTTLSDREEILSELRRILAQFSTLEMVATRREIAEPGTDTRATYKEDLPFQNQS